MKKRSKIGSSNGYLQNGKRSHGRGLAFAGRVKGMLVRIEGGRDANANWYLWKRELNGPGTLYAPRKYADRHFIKDVCVVTHLHKDICAQFHPS